MKQVKAIAGILLMLVVIIIAVQNFRAFSTTVKFHVDLLFFNWESPPMSLYLVAILTFLIGVFLAGIYGIVERFRLKNELRQLNSMLKEKDKELNSLRNLPVTGEDVSVVKSSDAGS